MSHAGLVADAEKLGFYQRRVVSDDNRAVTKWACKCSRCNAEIVWSYGLGTGIPFMMKHLRAAGWDHDKRGPICTQCIWEENARKEKVSKPETLSNPKLQRKVFALLDDHFDEDNRRYRPGWSDKKIADEAQTSVQFVEGLRRGAYGELAEDPAVTALRGELEALAEEAKKSADTLMTVFGDLEKKVSDLKTRVEGLAAKRKVG